MKIARFSVDGGDPRFGIVDDDELVVLAGDPIFQGFDTTGDRVKLADAKLLAPVIPRSKVVCVGLNYPEHRQDMAANVDAPDNPLIFLKPNTAVVGPGDAIQIPPVEGRITHESELVVIDDAETGISAIDAEPGDTHRSTLLVTQGDHSHR